ncbi:MAG: ABC transporter permease subunit, partial [Bacilli bacterium]
QSVDIGQMEAARSLGLSRSKAMRKVIIPQAFKNVLPALGNEFVTVVKESSIVSIVGIVDVMKITNVVSSQEFTMFEALIFAGLLYFIVTYSISKLIQRMERRLDVHARH